MIFNQSYYNAMDRGYYIPLEDEAQPQQPMSDQSSTVAPDIGLDIKDIGISAPPFSDQLKGLKSKIFQGAKKVELGFMGKGKGSMQGGNTTPGMYGKDERMDIRELAKLNKVQLTTHATPNAGSLAGFQQNRFDEHEREKTLHEIQRAIDFAADTTNGGAVVVHAQEYPRAIRDSFINEGFQAYPEEEERANRYLVDKRSGEVRPVNKNTPIYEPKYKRVDENDPYSDWVDIDGNVIPRNTTDTQQLFNRVPEWNAETTDFNAERRDWNYFEKIAADWNKERPDDKRTPEEMWYRVQMENAILRNKGGSLFHGQNYEEALKAYKDSKQALEFYESIEKDVPEEEQWRLLREDPAGRYSRIVHEYKPGSKKKPSEILKDQIKQHEMTMRFIHESSASSDAEAMRIQQDIDQNVSISKYAEEKSADTIARAAMYAVDRQKKTSKEGLWGWDVRHGEPFEKPLFIAIENFFPEIQGGHPDEIKKMVIDAREKMAEKLQSQQGMSKDGAWKEAEDRIKATWDTSHANMWRKYFNEKPGETMEQTDARFKKWYIEKAKDWVKNNIMGHVHVSDNFGWEDEHVVPGQGNAPIKEFIKEIKDKADKGEIDIIVEPAHQDYKSMLGGWKLFGSSIYGAQMGKRDGWLDVERGYFGRSAPPYFLYGETAPDPESWMLWSGTKME